MGADVLASYQYNHTCNGISSSGKISKDTDFHVLLLSWICVLANDINSEYENYLWIFRVLKTHISHRPMTYLILLCLFVHVFNSAVVFFKLFYKVQILNVHYLWETDVQPFAAATSSDKNVEQELSKKWFFPILPLSNRDEDYFGTSNANDRFWLSRLHCKFTFASICDTGIFKS